MPLPSNAYTCFAAAVEFGKLDVCELHFRTLAIPFVVSSIACPTVEAPILSRAPVPVATAVAIKTFSATSQGVTFCSSIVVSGEV